MSESGSDFIQPTLTGKTIELRPLQPGHAPALLRAAADGRLWDMKVTVVPGPDNIDAYIATALAGRQAGTVMPLRWLYGRTPWSRMFMS